MSYILNAIRKAEKQRHDDSVPSLEAIVQDRRRRSPRRFRSGIWISSLLGVAILSAAYVYQDPISYWGKRGVASIKFRSAHFYRTHIAGEEVTEQAQVVETPTNTIKLSDTQQKSIDAMQITVVSYSKNPDKRFVMVGSDVYREGDQLLNFPVLQIRQEGVVLGVNQGSVLVRP